MPPHTLLHGAVAAAASLSSLENSPVPAHAWRALCWLLSPAASRRPADSGCQAICHSIWLGAGARELLIVLLLRQPMHPAEADAHFCSAAAEWTLLSNLRYVLSSFLEGFFAGCQNAAFQVCWLRAMTFCGRG